MVVAKLVGSIHAMKDHAKMQASVGCVLLPGVSVGAMIGGHGGCSDRCDAWCCIAGANVKALPCGDGASLYAIFVGVSPIRCLYFGTFSLYCCAKCLV